MGTAATGTRRSAGHHPGGSRGNGTAAPKGPCVAAATLAAHWTLMCAATAIVCPRTWVPGLLAATTACGATITSAAAAEAAASRRPFVARTAAAGTATTA